MKLSQHINRIAALMDKELPKQINSCNRCKIYKQIIEDYCDENNLNFNILLQEWIERTNLSETN